MNSQKTLIGLIIAALAVFGLMLWYMATHPAPAYAPGTTTTLGKQHLADKGDYYRIDAEYPGSTVLSQTAGVEADASAVGMMRAFLETEATRFKANNLTDLTAEDIQIMQLGGDRIFTLDVEYQTYQSPTTLSYLYQIYADTMGAHPNAYYRSFTFDKKTGTSLELKDLFAGTSYLNRLSTISRAELVKIIAEREEVTVDEVDVDYINSGTVAEADTFQTFYLEGTNLVLVFPPYQVGPYVLGTVLLPIPLSNLSDILAPAYK